MYICIKNEYTQYSFKYTYRAYCLPHIEYYSAFCYTEYA